MKLKEKLKYWFKISALLDIQAGNRQVLVTLLAILYIGILSSYIYSMLGIENTLIELCILVVLWLMVYFIYNKYYKYGLRMYYFAICIEHNVKPKSKNITFK